MLSIFLRLLFYFHNRDIEMLINMLLEVNIERRNEWIVTNHAHSLAVFDQSETVSYTHLKLQTKRIV